MQAQFYHGDPLMVDHTPSADVAVGDIVDVGGENRIAHLDIASGELGALAAGGGVYQAAAETDAAFTAGDTLYWDATAGEVTKTVTGNKVLGRAVADKTTAGDTCLFIHDVAV